MIEQHGKNCLNLQKKEVVDNHNLLFTYVIPHVKEEYNFFNLGPVYTVECEHSLG